LALIESAYTNLLLAININLAFILPRFGDIAGFLLRRAAPPLFHANFGCSPWTRLLTLGLRLAKTLSVIIFEVTQLVTTVPQRYRQTYMDRRTTYCRYTALWHILHRGVKTVACLNFPLCPFTHYGN